jgi:putative aminopeptidase FrvX
VPLSHDAREFLNELMATPGPAGLEAAAQEVVRDYLLARLPETPGFADIELDRHDNLIATIRRDSQPHVALMGHVDTIGLMVTGIDGRGLLRVGMVGRPNTESLIGQIVNVHARDGLIPGVVFRAADSERKAEIADLAIDCGFAEPGDAAKLVRLGDYVTWAAAPRELADGRLIGPATDDRAGVFVACEVLLAAARDRTPNAPRLSAVSCIQEEGPTHLGAITTMSRLRPDLIVALDTTHAGDVDGGNSVKLGGGPVIARGGSIHNRTSDALLALAEDLKIPYQIEPIGRGTGTDLESAIQHAGGSAVGCLVSIPNRYCHTPNEILDPADLEMTIQLLTHFVTDLPKLF